MSEIITCKEFPHFLHKINKIYTQGGLIVYPTETLYGLGVDPFNEDAVKKLYAAKKRPLSQPISIAVSKIAMMEKLVEVNETAKKIYEHFLPGPITMLLKNNGSIPNIISAGGDKVGIRVPDHTLALKIIDSMGPITATSANLHGKEEPRNLEIATKQLGDTVEYYIDCGTTKLNGPSTIVDCTKDSINIIRKGVIPLSKIKSVFE